MVVKGCIAVDPVNQRFESDLIGCARSVRARELTFHGNEFQTSGEFLGNSDVTGLVPWPVSISNSTFSRTVDDTAPRRTLGPPCSQLAPPTLLAVTFLPPVPIRSQRGDSHCRYALPAPLTIAARDAVKPDSAGRHRTSIIATPSSGCLDLVAEFMFDDLAKECFEFG